MKPTDSDSLVVIECDPCTDTPRFYVGRTLEAALEAWRASPQNHDRAAKTLRGWMGSVARRTTRWCKAVIRTDSADHFAEDLARAGVIRVRFTN